VTGIRHSKQSLSSGRHFDLVARSYDAVRMSYPAALFDDMFDYAGSPAVRRALEIGCGTGQATKPVATRGVFIVCVEPGPNLAKLAQQNLAKFNNVRVVCSAFEEWSLEPEPFDLIFSANAIHWVNRRMRTRKTAKALRPGGTLAIFRSSPLRSHSAIESKTWGQKTWGSEKTWGSAEKTWGSGLLILKSLLQLPEGKDLGSEKTWGQDS
jgi:SAM-dependent methyltransferase